MASVANQPAASLITSSSLTMKVADALVSKLWGVMKDVEGCVRTFSLLVFHSVTLVLPSPLSSPNNIDDPKLASVGANAR